ncbi:MAG: GntR family transcriptional regulator [Rhizobiales bacterium]|nr:GntR family transcriptional regulator [Hyphomicrobiales bacterium]
MAIIAKEHLEQADQPQPAEEIAPAESGEPLYLRISTALQKEISGGVYPVSKMLPTETELCYRFGVSRFTIREALRRLSEIGLVQRRAGSGTVVVAKDPPTTFVHRVGTLRGLLAYPDDTYRELVAKEFIEADEEISKTIDCPVGKKWLRLTCLRKSADSPTPFCWGQFYVPPEADELMDFPEIDHETIHGRLKGLTHHQAFRAEIQISASAIRGTLATMLKVREGAPALNIVRRYFDEQGDNFTSTVTIHPEHRFVYSMDLARED